MSIIGDGVIYIITEDKGNIFCTEVHIGETPLICKPGINGYFATYDGHTLMLRQVVGRHVTTLISVREDNVVDILVSRRDSLIVLMDNGVIQIYRERAGRIVTSRFTTNSNNVILSSACPSSYYLDNNEVMFSDFSCSHKSRNTTSYILDDQFQSVYCGFHSAFPDKLITYNDSRVDIRLLSHFDDQHFSIDHEGIKQVVGRDNKSEYIVYILDNKGDLYANTYTNTNIDCTVTKYSKKTSGLVMSNVVSIASMDHIRCCNSLIVMTTSKDVLILDNDPNLSANLIARNALQLYSHPVTSRFKNTKSAMKI